MADAYPIHHWACSTHLCCRECRGFFWHCPACGAGQGRHLPDEHIPTFPATGDVDCSECGLTGLVTLLGWHPANALQQSFELPAAQRPQPPQQHRSNGSQRRLTLREWMKADTSLRRRVRAVNNAPRIREAHIRNGGTPVYRGGFWTYTRGELVAALDRIATQQGGRRG